MCGIDLLVSDNKFYTMCNMVKFKKKWLNDDFDEQCAKIAWAKEAKHENKYISTRKASKAGHETDKWALKSVKDD